MAPEKSCSTAVIVLTKRYKITGHIDLMPGSRLTDYISAIKSFFAVTDAVVEDINTGKVIFHFFSTFYLCQNKRGIRRPLTAN